MYVHSDNYTLFAYPPKDILKLAPFKNAVAVCFVEFQSYSISQSESRNMHMICELLSHPDRT